jgi:choline-sulfatase
VRKHLQEYYAIVTHLDTQIGRILEALDRSGKAAETLVIFTADNGLALGQHGLLGKQSLYDHSVRVPLILAGPGVPAGKRVGAFVYLPSLFATACELAGIPLPLTVVFPSLVPLVNGQKSGLYEDIYAAYVDKQRMVRTDRWKLILTPAARAVQLFDMRDDPWERHNLADDQRRRDVIDNLYARLKRWMKSVKDPLPIARLDETSANLRPSGTSAQAR